MKMLETGEGRGGREGGEVKRVGGRGAGLSK